LYGLVKAVIFVFSFFASYSLSFAANNNFGWLDNFDQNTNISDIIQSFFGNVDDDIYGSKLESVESWFFE